MQAAAAAAARANAVRRLDKYSSRARSAVAAIGGKGENTLRHRR